MTNLMIIPFFLPLLAWAAVAIAGSLLGVGVISMFKGDTNKLGLLGMHASGKTRFLNFLQKVPYIEKNSGRDDYEEFTFTTENRKKIIIKAGVDIGGGNIYRSSYNSIIKDSDVVFYFFDIDKYFKNEKTKDNELYQRDCNSRFEHVYSESLKRSNILKVIATHRDNCNLSDDEMKSKLFEIIRYKSYKSMLENVDFINLTNTGEVKKLVNKYFK
ncbi:GTPase domain-containing protein [Flavobacterium ardleyense]|uniref:GTPase domain-containing protein n=1 Tax=Flavobacterium ardleyense TaxID=2038737 RepID=UPI00298CE284|nr:GTPase domain-containing protein [Flavobacterium ardleyense]